MSEEKREASTTNLISVFDAKLNEVVSLVKQSLISIG